MYVVGGESLIDLVAQPIGPDKVMRMEAYAGGSPYNCAIALAKLGNKSGYLCPISKDGFGDVLLQPLLDAGAEPLIKERVAEPSSLAVVTLNGRGQAQYEFYRSADRAFTEEGLRTALPDDLELLQIGGFCSIEPEDAAIWLKVADEALGRGAILSMDPNVRPSLVSDVKAYKQRLSAFFDRMHIIKLSDEDLMALDADKSVEEHASDLLTRPNCKLVVVTLGEKGSRAFTANSHAAAPIYKPPIFGDTVGAGDSLMAGVIARLTEREDLTEDRLGQLDAAALEDILWFGAVVAGLNCAEHGCNPPVRADVGSIFDAPRQ